MWRYRELMPLLESEKGLDQPVTLGEGWTPLLRARVNAAFDQLKKQPLVDAKRTAAIDRKAAQLGIAPGAISNRPGAEEGLEEMTAAMRRLGLLKRTGEAGEQ
jgi:hypothetical protein